MIKFIKWFFTPTKKELVCDNDYLYDKLIELEDRIRVLEEENIEQTNALYEIANSLEARIDILASEPYNLNKFAVE